ncbi:hypothetical protein [Mucilaginibacter dorajii]|uniref:Transposase n=1 Tax=Mucilaginibacter dorajii TaxID=692994 RepID=A0ABP7PE28_9SPHI|nr:hypothetical protein [Mucilaginibacter dorajii]MCS3734698.1 hypothetical protein [Mucilaginibacter dorajii]
MKQQVIEDVNIIPHLNKACGLDMHKDKIPGFISGKRWQHQEFNEFGTYTCPLKQIGDWLQNCPMENTGICRMSLFILKNCHWVGFTTNNKAIHIIY